MHTYIPALAVVFVSIVTLPTGQPEGKVTSSRFASTSGGKAKAYICEDERDMK